MEDDQEYAVSRFLKLCFSTRSSREVTVGSSDVEDEQYDEVGGKEICCFLWHNFMDTELRRSVANFARCYLSGSIAGAAVRSNLSAEHTNMFRDKLLIFSGCQHRPPHAVCVSCASLLLTSAKSARNMIHCAAQISIHIAESVLVSSEEPLRLLAKEVALILQ